MWGGGEVGEARARLSIDLEGLDGAGRAQRAELWHVLQLACVVAHLFSALLLGAVFDLCWHPSRRQVAVSSPCVPPLAPQSCGPSEHVEAEAPRVRREDGRWGEMGRDCARWGRNDAAVLQAERGEALGGGGRHIHRQDGLAGQLCELIHHCYCAASAAGAAELICSAAKSLEPSGAHASA